MKYPALAPKTGRLTMYPHNGTIPVNGGRETVYGPSGKSLNIVPSRCRECGSLYHYMTEKPSQIKTRCPYCDLENARKSVREYMARRWKSDPEHREKSKARFRAWYAKNTEYYVRRREANREKIRQQARESARRRRAQKKESAK